MTCQGRWTANNSVWGKIQSPKHPQAVQPYVHNHGQIDFSSNSKSVSSVTPQLARANAHILPCQVFKMQWVYDGGAERW